MRDIAIMAFILAGLALVNDAHASSSLYIIFISAGAYILYVTRK